MNFANAGQSKLAAILHAADTTLTVASATPFPAPPFHIVVEQELMTVTAVAGTTFTVTRAIEGTIAVDHASGVLVTNTVTAADFAGFAAGTPGDMFASFVNAITSLTNPSNTTLAIATLTVVIATAACSVKLPAPVAGHVVGLVVDNSSTNLLTLKPNGAEHIQPGGFSSRVLWSGEAALLYSNGTDWVKIAGLSRTMSCFMARTSQDTVSTGTTTDVPLDNVIFDNTGLMGDLVNNRINLQRVNPISIQAAVRWNNISVNTVRCITTAQVTQTGIGGSSLQSEDSLLAGSYGFVALLQTFNITGTGANNVRLQAFQNSGVNQNTFGQVNSPNTCYLIVTEIPEW